MCGLVHINQTKNDLNKRILEIKLSLLGIIFISFIIFKKLWISGTVGFWQPLLLPPPPLQPLNLISCFSIQIKLVRIVDFVVWICFERVVERKMFISKDRVTRKTKINQWSNLLLSAHWNHKNIVDYYQNWKQLCLSYHKMSQVTQKPLIIYGKYSIQIRRTKLRESTDERFMSI